MIHFVYFINLIFLNWILLWFGIFYSLLEIHWDELNLVSKQVVIGIPAVRKEYSFFFMSVVHRMTIMALNVSKGDFRPDKMKKISMMRKLNTRLGHLVRVWTIYQWQILRLEAKSQEFFSSFTVQDHYSVPLSSDMTSQTIFPLVFLTHMSNSSFKVWNKYDVGFFWFGFFFNKDTKFWKNRQHSIYLQVIF